MAINFSFEPTRKNKNYIFISYAHKDAEKVAPYVYELHRRGYEVWYDRGINALDSFKEAILKRIENCACFVAFISNNYVCSPNCLSETSWATTKNIQRLPVFIDKMDKLPDTLIYDIANVQYLNAYEYSRSEAVEIIANRAYRILTGQIRDWSDWNDSRVRTSASSSQNDECGKLIQAAHYWADLYQRSGGEENLNEAINGFDVAAKAFPYDRRVWMGHIRCEVISDLGAFSKDKVLYRLKRINGFKAHIKPEDEDKVRDEHAKYVCFFINNVNELIKKQAQEVSKIVDIFKHDQSLEKLIKTITDIVDNCPPDRHIRDSVSVSELRKIRDDLQLRKDELQPEINRLNAEHDKLRARIEKKHTAKNLFIGLGLTLGKAAWITIIIYLIASACYLSINIFNGNWRYGETPNYPYNFFANRDPNWDHFPGPTERLEHLISDDIMRIFNTRVRVSLDFFNGSIEFWSEIDPMYFLLPCVLLSLGIVLIFWLFEYDEFDYVYGRGPTRTVTMVVIIIVYILCAIPSLPYLFNEQIGFFGMLFINVLCSILPLPLVWCLIPRRAYNTFNPSSIPELIFAHPIIAVIVTLIESALAAIFSVVSLFF